MSFLRRETPRQGSVWLEGSGWPVLRSAIVVKRGKWSERAIINTCIGRWGDGFRRAVVGESGSIFCDRN